MGIIVLLPQYIFWHYSYAFLDLKKSSGNIIWFVWNFFSIDILLKTLITPWRRLAKDQGSRHPSFFSNFLINMIMRLVGLFIRGTTVFSGLVVFGFTSLSLAMGFILWLIAPFLIVSIFLYGVSFFI